MVARKEHGIYCFEALIAKLKGDVVDEYPDQTEFPLFVTWKKQDVLRGCIGTFNPHPLSTGLRSFSIKSAIEDSRFAPIKLAELPHLHCGVSLLHDFRPGRSWDDWEVGRDGVQVRWKGDSGLYHSATFLPEVALEQGWDQIETMEQIVKKAGQKFHPSILADLHVTTYESSKSVVSYAEFEASRK